MEIWKIVQADYINRNVGATAEAHRQAVSDALDAGEQVSEDVLADYPQFKKRMVQLDETNIPERQEKIMMPNIPEEKSVPVDPIQAYKDKQDAEVAKFKAAQDAEVARVKASQDAEIAKFKGIGNSAISAQDAEIARVKREQDAEIAKMNSTAVSYTQQQDAEIARMKREQDEAMARSSLGKGSSVSQQQSAPAEEMPLQSEEEMLSTIEEPGALEDRIPEFNEPGTPEDTFSQDELLKLHLARSRQARVIDERYRARDVVPPGDQQGNRRWVRNPAKTDVEGIDTPR